MKRMWAAWRKANGAGGADPKALVVIAAEENGKGMGRIRMSRAADASARSLEGFVQWAVVPGGQIHTDGWDGYAGLPALGYAHEVTVLRGLDSSAPTKLLPRVHRVAALLKRWLLGIHQGAVRPNHLEYDLDEFTFRFNRRTSRSRGKLFHRLIQQAVQVEPAPYKGMVGGKPQCPPSPQLVRGYCRQLDSPEPENSDYFRDAQNVERVQNWRKEHPCNWKLHPRKTAGTLQDAYSAQPNEVKEVAPAALQEACAGTLQDVCRVQVTLLDGLISKFTDCTLQDDIVIYGRRLIANGQDILDQPSRRLAKGNIVYDAKENPATRTPAAGAGAVQLD
jgi:hypothetical protein